MLPKWFVDLCRADRQLESGVARVLGQKIANELEAAMSIDNEPAVTGELTLEAMAQHLAQTVRIEVFEPRIHLSQGSWLRCSRREVSNTIRYLISISGSITDGVPPRVHLTVHDHRTAASCRRLTDEQRALFAERDARAEQMGW